MVGDGEYPRVGKGRFRRPEPVAGGARPVGGPDGFSRLGPYLLLRTSGAGGMGRIDLCLRAQPGGIAKLCVLKRMHAELRSPDFLAGDRVSVSRRTDKRAVAAPDDLDPDT